MQAGVVFFFAFSFSLSRQFLFIRINYRKLIGPQLLLMCSQVHFTEQWILRASGRSPLEKGKTQTPPACFESATDFALCMRDKQVVLGIIINYSQLSPVVFMGQDTLLR